METKIESNLLEKLTYFVGMSFKSAKLIDKQVEGKRLLVLELVFSDNGLWKTLCLFLDRDLTTHDYPKIREIVTKDGR